VNYAWTVACDPGIAACPAPGTSPTAIPPATISLNPAVFIQQNATYTIVPSIGTCTGTPATFVFHINPIPDLTITPANHPVICSGAATNFQLASQVANPAFSWSAAGDPHITPASLTGQTDNPILRTFANSGTSPENVSFTLFAAAAGCTSLPVTYSVPVNPVADVILSATAQTLCSGTPTTAVNFSTTVTGTPVTYSWSVACDPAIVACPPSGGPAPQLPSATLTLNGSTFVQKNATYTITPAIGACPGTPSTHTVFINPIPDLTISPAAHPAICSAAPTNFTLHSQVASPAFQWNSTAGANIAPASLVNQADNPVQRTFTNSGIQIEPVVFTLTASAAGCTSLPVSYTVNVSPKPSVILPSIPANPQQVCSGAVFTSVPLQSSVTIPGVSYGWTAAAFDPLNPTTAITGFTTPNNGNAIPGENITSSLLTQGVIRYSVTPTFTTDGVGCNGDPVLYEVLVNPSPTVSLTPADPTGQTICSGGTTVPITFVPNASPSIYTWLAVETVGVSGATANGTTDFIPAQTLTTTGPVQGHVKYQVTPIYQGGGTFTCPGGVSYSTIFVNPLPEPAISGRNLVCELQPSEKYSTPQITGNSYNWAVTGASAVINPNSSEVTVTWGPYTSSPGTLTVTEIINATGCQKTTPPFQVTLQQRPIPNITGPVNFVCDQSGGHRYETEKNMTNYTWTVTGGTITSGGGLGNDFAIVTWNTPGVQTIEVNYLNALNCPGFPSKILPVTVNPLPNTTITEGTGPNCEGADHTYLVPPDPACTYAWSVNPASRGIITGGQGTATINILWSSFGPATLGVTATNGTTTCVKSGTHLLEVHPKPIPSFAPCFDLITTTSGKKFTLRGANPFIPGQGVFSGNRVSLNTMTGLFEFDPFGASAGVYPVTYTFTNNYGCSASTNPVSVSVLNTSFTCGGDLTDPRDGKIYRTAMLGGRCWMTQNLNYGSTLDPSYQPQSDNCSAEKYCSPDDLSCAKYGGFYQWNEVMQYGGTSAAQGLCPPEWHVPSEAEWQQLIDNISVGVTPPADAIAAGFLKDMKLNPGFYALLDGLYYLNSNWSFNSGNLTATMFWTSTVNAQGAALARGMNSIDPSVSRYWSKKGNAFSVRCLKDIP
jgi:uncharacterized protein (TIGR02145 family)